MNARLRFGSIAFVALAAVVGSMGACAATLDPLYSFCSKRGCIDGTEPDASLMRDTAGNLFGMTGTGGVYELSNASGKWKQTALRL
jgi:hypothetical protein